MNGFLRFKGPKDLQDFWAIPMISLLGSKGYIKATRDERTLIFQGVDSADLPVIRSAAIQMHAEVITSTQYETTG